MPTICSLINLQAAVKAVAKYAMTDSGNPMFKLCSQLRIHSEGGLLYLFAWNCEKVGVTRIGCRGDDLPPTLIRAALLNELLQSFGKENERVILDKEVGERLSVRIARNTSRLNAGINIQDWRNVADDVPAEWPVGDDGLPLPVAVKLLNDLPQPSTEKILFWKGKVFADTHKAYIPAVGYAFAIPDFGILCGEKRGKNWDFTDLLTGSHVGGDNISEALEKIQAAGPEKIAELRAGLGLVPDIYPKGPAPKGAEKAQRLAEKISKREEGYEDAAETLLAYAPLFGEEATAAMVAGLKLKQASDAEEAKRDEEERAANEAKWKAEREAEQREAQAERERRSAFAATRFDDLCLSFAPANYKPERKEAWVVKNRVDFRVGLECWVNSKAITDRDFYSKPTQGEWKRAQSMAQALDQAYRPEHYEAQREQIEAARIEREAKWEQVQKDLAAEHERIDQIVAEEHATRPDDPPPPAEALREDDSQIPGKVRAAIPMLAPYASEIQVRGWFTWVIPVDTEALQALLLAGFSRAVKFGGVYGPPEHARKLPVRPCHTLPNITIQPYH